jgi:hypothetical protein
MFTKAGEILTAVGIRLLTDSRRRQRFMRIVQFRSRYAFQVRFDLGERQTLSFETKEVRIGQSEDVRMVALGENAINKAKKLALIGRGYRTEAAAWEAASRWQAYVELAFARVNMGADFSGRRIGGVATEYGLRMFWGETWRPVLNNFPRMVFKQRPWPKFFRMGPLSGTVGRNPNAVLGAIERAASMEVTTSERQALAYNLYSASFSEPSEDARFVMLMMALETLIELAPRGEQANRHVDALVKLTAAAELPENEAQSMIGVLQWLRNESISQAGRRLVRSLGEQRYATEEPSTFFTGCYEIRSRLVHGGFPRASVDGRVADLERMLSDLLSGELLDAVDINALAAESLAA